MEIFMFGYQSEPVQFWQIVYLLSIAFSTSMLCWGLTYDFLHRGLLKSNKAITIFGICSIGGIIANFTLPWGFFIHFAILCAFLPTGAVVIAIAFSLWCFYLMASVMFPRTC